MFYYRCHARAGFLSCLLQLFAACVLLQICTIAAHPSGLGAGDGGELPLPADYRMLLDPRHQTLPRLAGEYTPVGDVVEGEKSFYTFRCLTDVCSLFLSPSFAAGTAKAAG
jgi:hypothetical protein